MKTIHNKFFSQPHSYNTIKYTNTCNSLHKAKANLKNMIHSHVCYFGYEIQIANIICSNATAIAR